MRLNGLAAGAVVAGLSTTALAVARGLRRSLPRISGDVRVSGIGAAVEIRRDPWGVPHIQGQSLADVYFGLGYAHAQDRPFQLEVHRRIASGTLAAMVGEPALAADRISRYMGFRRLAERDVAELDPDERVLLAAYSAGVSSVLTSPSCRPIEFALLRHRPTEWGPTDSLAWARFLGWALSFNYQTEYLRYRLLRSIGADLTAAIEPQPDVDSPASIAPSRRGDVSPGFSRPDFVNAEALLRTAVLGGASNAWAVTGERSTTGMPLLANDPHLPPQCPPIWYEAHLSGDGLNVAGATTPGAPGVIIGHNGQIAWGVTVCFLDTQDLFAEHRHPDGTPRYEVDGHWEPASVIREEIKVRGRRDPVVEEILITRHGPVITPILPGETEPLSFQASSDDPAHALRSIVCLNAAQDWHEFDEAISGWTVGGLNFVYADRAGRVGLRSAGCVPDRGACTGVTPAPGWDSRFDWKDLLPDDLLPRVVDPNSGWVVTANNRPGSPSDSLLSREWPDGYRATRIAELLGSEVRHSPESFARFQVDLTSVAARELAPFMLAAIPSRPQDLSARDLLRDWNGTIEGPSAAAAVYESWKNALLRRVYQPVVGDEVEHQLGMGYLSFSNSNHNQVRLLSTLISLLRQRPPAWPNVQLAIDWDNALTASLSDAVDDLSRRLGADQQAWRWDRLHSVTFEHPIGVGALGRVFSVGPLPSGGDTETVCQTALDPRDPLTLSRSAASYRFIADVSDWDRCLSVLPTGQSGNVMSRHYRDHFELWRTGRHHPMPFSPEAVTLATRHTLVLHPADGVATT